MGLLVSGLIELKKDLFPFSRLSLSHQHATARTHTLTHIYTSLFLLLLTNKTKIITKVMHLNHSLLLSIQLLL